MNRTIHNDDDFDERGILKDGRSVRVSLTMRDSAMSRQANRITDGRTCDPLALHRPGFRIPVVNDRRAVRDAYAAYETSLVNRYKASDGERLCDDCDGEGYDEDGNKCATCHGEGILPLEDERSSKAGGGFGSGNEGGYKGGSSDAQTMKDQDYRAYDSELANAWRR